jgi:cold shock CspA family protein/arsenate reductase-like glutaredoxin family protein
MVPSPHPVCVIAIDMPEGTVKFFNRAKGFGFIVPDDGDKEIFLPPAALSAIGGVALSPGQRVSFETVADPKGPKAASLKILEGAPPKPQIAMAPRPQAAPPPVAAGLFCDPSTQAAQDVLAALEAQGQHPQIIDITVTPLTVPQLRKWSQTLAAKGQELVRRSSALFFDLQLDDRFLTEDEFWTAVVLHPALISGPFLVVRDRVRICRTAQDVKTFFASADDGVVSNAKEVSSRLMAMMRGEAVAPRPQPVAPEPVSEPVARSVAKVAEPKPAKKKAPAPVAAKPVKAKPVAKAVKAKPVAKVAKPAVKKAVAKPVKKKSK